MMNYVEQIFRDEIVISPYCGPQPVYRRGETTYPDRICEEQFRLLKNCGINVVFGHEDLMNTPTEDKAFEAMDICQKLGMGYMVRDVLSYEYCSDGADKTHYSSLTEEQKQELDQRYEVSLLRYKDHPAFAGVMFIDEPGESSFEGIARGKAVFDRVCPGKAFYVNLFPYYISAYAYQYGREQGGTYVDPLYTPLVYSNLDRYKVHLDRFLKTVDPAFVSFDAYPFVGRKEAENAIHRSLWDMTQYVAYICAQQGRDYWHVLQCGGRWCNDWNTRITTAADVCLQVSVALGYGAKTLQLYPGCFPNCCIGGIEHSSLIDEWGNLTEQYPLFQYAFMQVKAIQKHLVHAKLKGMIVSNSPYFGLLPSKEKIKEVLGRDKNGEMEIFDGQLCPDGNIQVSEYKQLKKVESTSQCIVSCFENEEETVYFLWNNSAYAASDVTLTFDDDYIYEHTQRTVTDTSEGKTLTIHALPAGENVLIRIVDKKEN